MQPTCESVFSYYGKGPKGFVRSDERILEDISILLTIDHYTDASYLSVSVEKGEVSLTGTDHYYPVQLLRIQQIISCVLGVTAIHDKTVVKDNPEETLTPGATTKTEENPVTPPVTPAKQPEDKKTKS